MVDLKKKNKGTCNSIIDMSGSGIFLNIYIGYLKKIVEVKKILN